MVPLRLVRTSGSMLLRSIVQLSQTATLLFVCYRLRIALKFSTKVIIGGPSMLAEFLVCIHPCTSVHPTVSLSFANLPCSAEVRAQTDGVYGAQAEIFSSREAAIRWFWYARARGFVQSRGAVGNSGRDGARRG